MRTMKLLLRAQQYCLPLPLVALLFGTSVTAAPTHRPHAPGIPNFDNVTETICRGGQPRNEGYRTLKELGVELVISFRGRGLEREQRQLAAEGIEFVPIPWSEFGAPKPEQVKKFFDLLDSHAGRKVFLHCRRGAERTGVMVALYRVARMHWTAEQAYQEMKAHGFRSFWFPHLREYVFGFASQSDRSRLPAAAPAPQTQ